HAGRRIALQVLDGRVVLPDCDLDVFPGHIVEQIHPLTRARSVRCATNLANPMRFGSVCHRRCARFGTTLRRRARGVMGCIAPGPSRTFEYSIQRELAIDGARYTNALATTLRNQARERKLVANLAPGLRI